MELQSLIITVPYEGYVISTDRSLMQVEVIHHWLSTQSYWAQNIPFETVQTAVDNSFCMGIFKDDKQIGFGRLVTDYAVFAYLADVYVEEEHRGKGLSKIMMQTFMEADWLKHLRRVMLATRDAHGLYAQYGFTPIKVPERLMEIVMSAAQVYGG